jgi:RNA polymerase sigma factor (sigma-70 family)
MANAEAAADPTYRALIERVVAGEEAAWREFAHQFSRLVFSFVWRYAGRDQDLCAELYLYVMEKLHQPSETGETFFRLRRYLASVDAYGGRGRLSTWLGRVTANLVSDYFREREGRRTVPRDIGRMDAQCQQVFKLLYWDNLSETEAFSTLRSGCPSLSRNRFDAMVEKVNRALKDCNRWSLYSEVLRRTPALPLHPVAEDGEVREVQAADPCETADPSRSLSAREEESQARSLGQKLLELLRSLPEDSRRMLWLRFQQEMSAAEIGKILRMEDKKVYSEIDRLKHQLRDRLEGAGFRWENLDGRLDAIEGVLESAAIAGGAPP